MRKLQFTIHGGPLPAITKKCGSHVASRFYWTRARWGGDVLRLTDSSTVFQWLSYDERRGDVTAQFTSGARYLYARVGPEVAKEWFTSTSPGAFFNRSIRGSYVTWRLV
jgi:hypothetical protein